jgi:hypothetical protein
MAEPADVFLARNLGRISRSPEVAPAADVQQVDVLDDMILEMALTRIEQIDAFSPLELEFFARGEEEEAVLLASLDEMCA